MESQYHNIQKTLMPSLNDSYRVTHYTESYTNKHTIFFIQNIILIHHVTLFIFLRTFVEFSHYYYSLIFQLLISFLFFKKIK